MTQVWHEKPSLWTFRREGEGRGMDEILVGHERDPYNGRIPLEKKN